MTTTSLEKVNKALSAPVTNQTANTTSMTLKGLLGSDNIKKRFEEVLGKKAPGFISSILTATQANPKLAQCDPMTILSSAAIAASLDLPINSSLGFAHLVPYSNKCQFQMGWRGFVQLAARTGQYKTMNVTEVYEGEVKESNRFTGFMDFDETGKKSDKIVGYVAYLKMINGFEKWCYMTREQVEKHGRTYSKSFTNGRWQTDFDAMAKKTVIKLLLSRWGMMSVDIQQAIDYDQAVVEKLDGNPTYIDVGVGEQTETELTPTTKEQTNIQSKTDVGEQEDRKSTIWPE